jgi:hypothetical protein
VTTLACDHAVRAPRVRRSPSVFEEEQDAARRPKLLICDEARQIAANIAKIPQLPRHLKSRYFAGKQCLHTARYFRQDWKLGSSGSSLAR